MQLQGGELSILIDHCDSNEPVLGAGLEVESGALKALATFRAESGDCVVTDAAFLKALAIRVSAGTTEAAQRRDS